MAHTPGPWRPYFYVGNQRLKTGHWGLIGGDGRPLFCDGVKASVGNQESDIRLAAAAPDLLAALRSVQDELIELYERAYPDDESDNDTTRAIDAAIAAIAKAEGRTDDQ